MPDLDAENGGLATGIDDGERGSRLADAIDAVYGYATSRDNWEHLIDFLGHLDHEAGRREQHASETRHIAADFIGHLRRAGDLAARLHAAPEAEAPPPYALLALDRDFRVVAVNDEGREVFASLCVPPVPGALLKFRSPDHASVLRRAVREMPSSDAAASPQLVRFLSDEGDVELFCYLTPGDRLSAAMSQAAKLDLNGPAPLCVLIATMPEQGLSTPDMLRRALGLTPAEARLAQRLKLGLSLKEAADELDIAVNTARNQLRSIFEKLGVNRQSDLVRHLTELAALAAAIHPYKDDIASVAAARRTVELPDGRKLAFRDLGQPDGFPVFILHPLVLSSLMRPQEADVARRCGVRLLSIERPGNGLSTPDPAFSFRSFAHDLGAMADALGIERFAILGWASGAPFAIEAASVLGPRVARLALATPRLAFRGDLKPTSKAAQFFGGLRRHPWLFDAVFSIMRAKRSRKFFRPMVRNFLETSLPDKKLFETDTSLLDCFADGLIEAVDNSSAGVLAELNFFAVETPVDASGLACPLFVWHGAQDGMNDEADVRRMLNGIPVTRFHIMPDDGHMVVFAHFGDILAALRGGEAPAR